MMVRFLPGWESPNGDHFHTVYEEIFVIEGRIETDAGHAYDTGCYIFKPPLTMQSRPKSRHGALAYVSFGGKFDFVAASRLSDFKT